MKLIFLMIVCERPHGSDQIVYSLWKWSILNGDAVAAAGTRDRVFGKGPLRE